MKKMSHLDYVEMRGGKENKVRHFGDLAESVAHGIKHSKHHLNLKGSKAKALNKMKSGKSAKEMTDGIVGMMKKKYPNYIKK